jgi:hypothetical protein
MEAAGHEDVRTGRNMPHHIQLQASFCPAAILPSLRDMDPMPITSG